MTAVLTQKHVHQHSNFLLSMEIPQYNDSVLEAMIEAKSISQDENVRGYLTMQELKAALESDC